ncbi:MAG TPA: DEAD/DEAH box helicase family protein [Candidatus Omnitrophota bacterium]|nr:DEAD/DEAH box helicase family protein [Candidatus Omnitrophota bacterium]
MQRYAQIAIALPIDRTFHYSIPDRFIPEVAVGKRVFVPFAHRAVVGYIVGISDHADVKEVKDIAGVIDKEPVVDAEMLSLCRWIADNYFCSWGEAIQAVIPGGIKRGKASLGSRLKEPHINVADFPQSFPHDLTEEQDAALKAISADIENRRHETFLLHGITASGKTEVYLQAIDIVIKNGRQAIMLVPEISLTPQTIERFVSRFGSRVAVIHSRLTAARRFLEWKRIRDGEVDIVVGARSAIFSPVRDLGLVIIDEEHETSY